MEMTQWAYALIKAEKLADRYVRALRKEAAASVSAAFWQAGGFEEVARLSVRKNKLIGLKLLVREVFSEIDGARRELLEAKIGGADAESLARERGVSERTVYRELKCAVGAFVRGLLKRGCCEIWLERNFGGEPLVRACAASVNYQTVRAGGSAKEKILLSV